MSDEARPNRLGPKKCHLDEPSDTHISTEGAVGQISVYSSAKAAPTSSWMGMEDGYCTIKVTAPGDKCAGFHTNVDMEGF
jgi:hypothetical protein